MEKSRPLPTIALDANLPDTASTTIGLPELVQIDIAVMKLYRELAERHDALVDEVMKKLQQQAQ